MQRSLGTGTAEGPAPAPRREAGYRAVLQGVVEPLLALLLATLLILALGALLLPDLDGQAREGPEAAGGNGTGSGLHDLVLEQPRLVPRILALQSGVFLVAGLLLVRLRVQGGPDFPRSGLLRAVLLGLAGGVAALVGSGLLGFLLTLAGWPVEEQAWLAELLREPQRLGPLIPWIVVAAPVAEEVFFRGYMFRFMERRLGFRAALLLSSAVFAAVHLNPSGIPVYLVIAVVMAWVYRLSGRLISPIVAHATLNGVVLLASAMAPGSGRLPG
jgi:membrane protease YdiL (CAAX protease family)